MRRTLWIFVLGLAVGLILLPEAALAAPAGVGVREAILSISLAPAVGSAPALAIAVASRAASLVADVIAWAALKRWAR